MIWRMRRKMFTLKDKFHSPKLFQMIPKSKNTNLWKLKPILRDFKFLALSDKKIISIKMIFKIMGGYKNWKMRYRVELKLVKKVDSLLQRLQVVLLLAKNQINHCKVKT